MATKKKAAGVDIDWYLISIARLKQIGLIVFVLVLSGVGYLMWARQRPDPKNAAEAAISEAKDALNALASSKDFTSHRAEFDRAQKKLDEANAQFASSKYGESEAAAVESQSISRGAISGAQRENDAQFLTVEGEVQFAKSSNNDFKRADVRTALFNGDWVKTGDNSSAELIFSNGSLYTVGSNALLEIYTQFNPATAKKSNSVQMKVGSVEVATTDDASTVKTPGTQVVVDSESTTQVGVDKGDATSVVATKGSASVAPATGGEAVKLGSGQKVTATSQGSLSPVKKLLPPPNLTAPFDSQVFSAGESKVGFVWDAVPGAGGYVLQVSRSPLFTSLEINSKRQKTSATARLTGEGAFYWRVASVGTDGDAGPFTSPARRFRATGTGRSTGTAANPDAPPPKLVMNRPYLIGTGYYIIEGTTDPGSTVLINNEEVDVESTGHFKKLISLSKIGRNEIVIKAINAAGKQTVQSQTVLVEE